MHKLLQDLAEWLERNGAEDGSIKYEKREPNWAHRRPVRASSCLAAQPSEEGRAMMPVRQTKHVRSSEERKAIFNSGFGKERCGVRVRLSSMHCDACSPFRNPSEMDIDG